MKWIARFALVIGVALGALYAVWMLRGRQVPTLNLRIVPGRGPDVGLTWVKLKELEEVHADAE
jgi:hypothetical protein